jgi:hypothetical protein
MSSDVCLTIDVEDWYDGMAVLGESFERPEPAQSGLAELSGLLHSAQGSPSVTLFVVGNYAKRVHDELVDLAQAGHEIASHGPDHGRLPDERQALIEWLRQGREVIEDIVQRPVDGFRSPRFDVPQQVGLAGYREALAEAGFRYVSDTHQLGEASPLREVPVLTTFGVPLGGGSYQRLLPMEAVAAGIRSSDGPAVLYYHSYDFGATLPSTTSIRSVAVAKQLVGRGRIAGMFSRILKRYGSKACGYVER